MSRYLKIQTKSVYLNLQLRRPGISVIQTRPLTSKKREL